MEKDNARSTALLAVAKEYNLDIELVETRPPNVTADYLKLNPLGRVPTFVGSNGFVLTESIAIAIYRMSHLSFRSLPSFLAKDESYYQNSYPCQNTVVDHIEF